MNAILLIVELLTITDFNSLLTALLGGIVAFVPSLIVVIAMWVNFNIKVAKIEAETAFNKAQIDELKVQTTKLMTSEGVINTSLATILTKIDYIKEKIDGKADKPVD